MYVCTCFGASSSARVSSRLLGSLAAAYTGLFFETRSVASHPRGTGGCVAISWLARMSYGVWPPQEARSLGSISDTLWMSCYRAPIHPLPPSVLHPQCIRVPSTLSFSPLFPFPLFPLPPEWLWFDSVRRRFPERPAGRRAARDERPWCERRRSVAEAAPRETTRGAHGVVWERVPRRPAHPRVSHVWAGRGAGGGGDWGRGRGRGRRR